MESEEKDGSAPRQKKKALIERRYYLNNLLDYHKQGVLGISPAVSTEYQNELAAIEDKLKGFE